MAEFVSVVFGSVSAARFFGALLTLLGGLALVALVTVRVLAVRRG